MIISQSLVTVRVPVGSEILMTKDRLLRSYRTRLAVTGNGNKSESFCDQSPVRRFSTGIETLFYSYAIRHQKPVVNSMPEQIQ